MAESIIQKKSFEFSLEVIQLYKRLQGQREFVLSNQLLRSGTSIGANVEEASAGQSRKVLWAKMCIAAKEARETRYWLRLLQASQLVEVDLNSELSRVEELIRLLTSIVKTTRKTL
ncbi:MAG: four helix bundle protein [Stenomitos rutilans HA7619-LM2]|jgi:four helix bundle protein|nr:four helix bundle protein [Stenomitos rutilans HA7619-LM2]